MYTDLSNVCMLLQIPVAEQYPCNACIPHSKLNTLFDTFGCVAQLVLPYWTEEPSARWRLAGVVGLTLATTGVR
jgi:hypothetical protein